MRNYEQTAGCFSFRDDILTHALEEKHNIIVQNDHDNITKSIVPTSEIFELPLLVFVQSGPSAKARWDFLWCNAYFRGQQTGTPDENGCMLWILRRIRE